MNVLDPSDFCFDDTVDQGVCCWVDDLKVSSIVKSTNQSMVSEAHHRTRLLAVKSWLVT